MSEGALPESWVAEGRAMRRAVARDFAALDGGRARVVATLDHRLEEDGPGTVVPIRSGDGPHRIVELARGADFTVLIAPETMGVLQDLSAAMREAGVRWLGSSPEAVALTRDKAALAGWLSARGIETPPCRSVSPREGLPDDARYPAVLKPIDGAGAIDTYFVPRAGELPAPARVLARSIMQPYVEGRPMSASYLVDSGGRAWLIAIGEQHITRTGGQFAYRGGRIPTAADVDKRPLRAAVEAVPGLRGFVGVDFIWDEARRRTTVLEINPRPTTSVVGLTRLLPPGRLAAAWIGACEPDHEGAALLPGLRALIDRQPPLSFDSAGHVVAAGGDG